MLERRVLLRAFEGRIFVRWFSDERRIIANRKVVGKLGDSTYLDFSEAKDRTPLYEKYSSQFEEVKRILNQKEAFSREIVQREAMTYYKELGLNEYYFQTASPHTIANNLACVLAAQIMHESSRSHYFPQIRQECDGEIFWMARASLANRKDSQNYLVEREMEESYLGLDGSLPAYRMQCYRSERSLFYESEGPTDHLRTYFLQKPDYPLNEVAKDEENISKLLDIHFYANKKGTATEDIYSDLNRQLVRDSTEQKLIINVAPRGEGFRVDCAFRVSPLCRSFYSRLGDSITICGLVSQRKYIEPLANGVTILTVFVENQKLWESVSKDVSVEERVQNLVSSMRLAYITPRSMFTVLAHDRILTLEEAAYAWVASKFVVTFSPTVGSAFKKISNVLAGSAQVDAHELNEVRSRLKKPPYTAEFVYECVISNPSLVKRLYREFESLHRPFYDENVYVDSTLDNDVLCLDNPDATRVFDLFRKFAKNIKRTNFWINEKLCFAFRLDPSFLPTADYPDLPYALNLFVDAEFEGFHVRFSEVSRGGIRIVQSFSPSAHVRNRQKGFDECYQLAHTQNFKNKDIPEGGSKGVIVLNQSHSVEHAAEVTPLAFKRYINSFLDLLLPDESVVDHLKKSEVCFLGPDENTGTGGLMDWAAFHARNRGAWFWKAFSTGKMPANGGIPHDKFGMTTSSVETYVRGIISKLNLNESSTTRCQTGGPDGDLGANALLISNCQTTSLIDGSGVLYDPHGLDISELRRLAKQRFHSSNIPAVALDYNEKLLSKEGFKISISDRDVKLPNGEIVKSGLLFRNEFHLNPLSSADLFNPCGGRPESISADNVDKLFNPDTGTPRFKYIVEGANVFITKEARKFLESKGVILFKDASTNKGGVTSSSLEVLASLSMTDEEFDTHMRVGDKQTEFYTKYVSQVIDRIKENARLEFEILWNEGLRTKTPRSDLTDILSAKILSMNQHLINSSIVWRDEQLVQATLTHAIPPSLLELVPLEAMRQRVPETYLRAICSKYLAARFHYKYGIEYSPLAIFEFFDDIRSS